MRLASASILLCLCAGLGGCQGTTSPTATAPNAEDAHTAASIGRVDASTRPIDREADAGATGARLDAALDAAEAPDAASLQTVDAASRVHDAAASVSDASAPRACTVSAPTSCPTPMPRYADVEPIFKQRCVVCHAPTGTGPWPLDDYQHVSDWQVDIRADLLSCSMPPPDAGLTIPPAESMQILTWLRCNLPK